MVPMRPWVAAPQASMGSGGVFSAAAADRMSSKPTWGPLPWVSTTFQPISMS